MLTTRFTISALAALLLTGGMFWFLHTMIRVQLNLAQLQSSARIEFTRLRKDNDVQSRREQKPKLEIRPEAPSTPTISTVSVAGPLQATALLTPEVSGRMGVQKISVRSGGTDRDVMPLVRIEPEYPWTAAQRGIEGWVVVRFTITTIGTVKDAMVVNSSPKHVFDDAAVRAVSRWKYNPKIEEAVAVERRGVQVMLRFQLEKQQ